MRVLPGRTPRASGPTLLLPLVLLLHGCIAPPAPDPVPIENVAVLATGLYRVNGMGCGEREVHVQLKAIADRYRQPDGSARAIVRLIVDSQVDYDEVRMLEDYLVSIGLSRIEHDH